MTVTINTENVMVGSARLWVALYTDGVAEPMPDDDVARGEDWGGNWIYPGATDKGVDFTVQKTTQDTTVDEQSTPAKVTVSKTDITIDTVLSEDTLDNMKLAYGGGTITTVAAGADQIGKKTLTLVEGLDLITAGFEGVNPAGFWRRASIPKVISVAQVKTTYQRADGKRMYPVTLRALCSPDEVQIVDMTAEATA